MSDRRTDWENVWLIIGIIVFCLLFAGEPDLQDALVHWLAPEVFND